MIPEVAVLNVYRFDHDCTWAALSDEFASLGIDFSPRTLHYILNDVAVQSAVSRARRRTTGRSPAVYTPRDLTVFKLRKFLNARGLAYTPAAAKAKMARARASGLCDTPRVAQPKAVRAKVKMKSAAQRRPRT